MERPQSFQQRETLRYPLGTNLLAGQPFLGNAYQNILAGAGYLKSLPDPGDYYSRTPSLRQVRDNALNALTPRLTPFFNCLEGK